MRNRIPTNRRGITLMEVMISIGILAIGLTSVLSIIPAGKSEVSRALVYDRATALAANALADAATFGLLKPDSFSSVSPSIAIFDPTLGSGLATGTATLKPSGIFSSATSAALTGSNAAIVLRQIAQGRDDVSYKAPANDDALPTNQFPAVGPRAFQGRMSCILAVTGTAPLAAGNFATLSAIVFHNRDLSSSAASYAMGTCDASSSTIAIDTTTVPADRTLREVVRAGTVLFSPATNSFHQLSMAAIDETTSNVFVTFSGSQASGGSTIQILLDSVGLAEQTIMLEGPGPWSQ